MKGPLSHVCPSEQDSALEHGQKVFSGGWKCGGTLLRPHWVLKCISVRHKGGYRGTYE